jgi:hypothetical protein
MTQYTHRETTVARKPLHSLQPLSPERNLRFSTASAGVANTLYEALRQQMVDFPAGPRDTIGAWWERVERQYRPQRTFAEHDRAVMQRQLTSLAAQLIERATQEGAALDQELRAIVQGPGRMYDAQFRLFLFPRSEGSLTYRGPLMT